MGYFHNQGYYEVEGDDFLDVLRLRGEPDPAFLAPHVELVKIRPGADARALLPRSLCLLRRHLAAAPADNPFPRFRARLERTSIGCRGAGSRRSTNIRSPRFANSARASNWPRPTWNGSRPGARPESTRKFGLFAKSRKPRRPFNSISPARYAGQGARLHAARGEGECWERATDSLRSRYAATD
jgi:hypothetical protein